MSPFAISLTTGAIILCALPAPAQGQTAFDTFTDPRDGYAYHIVAIGGARRFAENLRFKIGDSRCYEGDEVNCADPGWRVPSEGDWQTLERALGISDADIGKIRGCGDPVGHRLKFGGDTGFNVRYSGWIDPHRADSSIAMGRNAFGCRSDAWARRARLPRLGGDQPRLAERARQIHPAMNASPPRGVIAPSHRTPVSANAYKLPEKRTVPTTKSHPAQQLSAPGHRTTAHAAAINANAWYIWYRAAVSKTPNSSALSRTRSA
jgi:hypothetical protein